METLSTKKAKPNDKRMWVLKNLKITHIIKSPRINGNIKPTEARILIERIPQAEFKTAAGIVIVPGLTFEAPTDSTRKELKVVEIEKEPDAYQARVISLGPDVKDKRIIAGAVVLVGKYSGVDLFKDRTSIILTEHEVIAIIT